MTVTGATGGGDGCADGLSVEFADGCNEGYIDGSNDGFREGKIDSDDGSREGKIEGAPDGAADSVGERDGCGVGSSGNLLHVVGQKVIPETGSGMEKRHLDGAPPLETTRPL